MNQAEGPGRSERMDEITDTELDDPDAGLLAAVRRRERLAARRFLERYAPVVRAHLVRRFGDDPEHDDIVQAVFIEALSGLDGFREEASVETWLCRVAVNKARSIWRRRYRRRELAAGAQAAGAPLATRIDERPLDDRHDVARLLAQLPEELRRPFVLHHAAGCSQRELARLLRRPKSTIQLMLREAQARLRALVREEAVGHA